MSLPVTLYNVPIWLLREKIAGFRLLFAREAVVLQVSGVFKDEKGELAFLTSRKYTVDTTRIIKKYLYIWMEDGSVEKFVPVDENIAIVELS